MYQFELPKKTCLVTSECLLLANWNNWVPSIQPPTIRSIHFKRSRAVHSIRLNASVQCSLLWTLYKERAYRCTQGYSLRILCMRIYSMVFRSACKPEPLNRIHALNSETCAHKMKKQHAGSLMMWLCTKQQTILCIYDRRATVRLLRANLRYHSIRYSNLK